MANWRDFNRALVGRGSITPWIDEAVLAGWPAGGGKGRRYGDAAILAALSLRAVSGLTLRQTRGFPISLTRPLGLAVEVPRHSTFSRRAATLPVPKLTWPAGGPPLFAIDGRRGRKTVRGTVFPDDGLKVHGEGEWKVRVHGRESWRVWRKPHLVVDTRTGELHAHVLTPSGTHDRVELAGVLDGPCRRGLRRQGP